MVPRTPLAFPLQWGSIFCTEGRPGGEAGLCNLHVVPPGNLGPSPEGPWANVETQCSLITIGTVSPLHPVLLFWALLIMLVMSFLGEDVKGMPLAMMLVDHMNSDGLWHGANLHNDNKDAQLGSWQCGEI